MSDVPLNRNSYLDGSNGLASWLLTKDHKRIAMLYLISITIFFAVGGMFAAGIRMELITPAGDLWSPDLYNKLFTLHGVVMIFFFLIPSIPATLGNFLLPIMIGAKDLAFPRINLISWYIYVLGATITLAAVFNGGLDTGWTFYTPYSSMSSQTAVTTAALGVFVTGFSSILTGLNFIVTMHRMRAPGMTWFRLPLFVWAQYATSLRDDPRHAGHRHHGAARRRGTHARTRVLRSAARRRPGALPASVLVLLAPGGLHHDPAGHGRHQRTGGRDVAQADLRLQLRGVLEPRHRHPRLPRLGASPVRQQPVDLRRPGVLDHLDARRRPVRREDVQLDGDDVQGVGELGIPNVVGCRLHGAVHDWRPHRVCSSRRSASTFT